MTANAVRTGAPMRRNRPLVAVVAATVVSTTGSQMTYLALPWFVLVTTSWPRAWEWCSRSSWCRRRCSGS